MATVSTINLTVNLLDTEFVDTITERSLHTLSAYSIALQVMSGSSTADAGLPVSIKIYDSSGSVIIEGTDTDANGRSTIAIANDDIDFSGEYTALVIVNESKAASFPLTIIAEGTGVPIGTVVDWNDVQSYTNTATDGPVRPGTGITNTVNADGSNTHSVTYGSTAGTAAEGNDSRLSDARTPTAHASTHATGGSDPVTAADVNPTGTAIAAALGAKAPLTSLAGWTLWDGSTTPASNGYYIYVGKIPSAAVNFSASRSNVTILNLSYLNLSMSTSSGDSETLQVGEYLEFDVQELPPGTFTFSTNERGTRPIPAVIQTALDGKQNTLTFTDRKYIYVSQEASATDTRTGLNKYDYTKPFATIHAAMAAAISGDCILIGPGVWDFRPANMQNQSDWNASALTFKQGVNVRGAGRDKTFLRGKTYIEKEISLSDMSIRADYTYVDVTTPFIWTIEGDLELLAESESVYLDRLNIGGLVDGLVVNRVNNTTPDQGKLYIRDCHVNTQYDCIITGVDAEIFDTVCVTTPTPEFAGWGPSALQINTYATVNAYGCLFSCDGGTSDVQTVRTQYSEDMGAFSKGNLFACNISAPETGSNVAVGVYLSSTLNISGGKITGAVTNYADEGEIYGWWMNGEGDSVINLTPSLPLSLDANKRAVTLSAADFRALIDAAPHTPTVNAQTGTTYTLVLSDAGKIVTMANASANTLTIPTNASVAFEIGDIINVIMKGTGTTSIAGDAGVTVNGVSAGSGDMIDQWQGVALTKVGTDEWIISGAIGAFA